MLENKKAFIKNTIYYFFPFVFMTIIAAVFLYRSFSMLVSQNVTLIQTQMKNVLVDIEKDIAASRQTSDDICVDNTLSREKLLQYGLPVINGMKEIESYGMRLQFYPTIFLTYTEKQFVTKNATMKGQVFAEGLRLTEESLEMYSEIMKGTERFSSNVLEKEDGGKYLFLLYYYPQSKYIDEKRVGYVFDAVHIEDALEKTVKSLDGTFILTWEDKILTEFSYQSQTKKEIQMDVEDLWALYENKKSRYTMISCEGDYFGVRMYILLDNRSMSGDLFEEAIKMIVVGGTIFCLLSLFLWLYGKYRYRLLYELRKLAEGDQSKIAGQNDFDVIRGVLNNSFEKIGKQEETLELFRKETRKQLSWMLLRSTPPEDIHISALMDSCGMIKHGSYCGVLCFVIENEVCDAELELEGVTEILVHYVMSLKEKSVFVAGITLATRDSDHRARLELIQTIEMRLIKKGYSCSCVSCGLIYDRIEQMHCSQEEAYSILHCVTYIENRKEVLFFDEVAHVTKKVPNFVAELLDNFNSHIQQQKEAEILEVLGRLIAESENMSEELYLYLRYKVIGIIIQNMRKDVFHKEKISVLVGYIEISTAEFWEKLQKFIQQNVISDIQFKTQAEQVLEYIQERYKSVNLSLNVVAEHFQISERSVNRILKNSVGKTYKNYLDSLRLEEACLLLAETEIEVKEIVRLVGYFDVSSFIRLFKQNFGMTPSEYKRKKKDTVDS